MLAAIIPASGSDDTANYASAWSGTVKPCAYGAPLRGCGA